MFLGHYAVALAAKRAAPGTNLGVLIAAAQFIDLLWPVFLLIGVEHVRIAPGNTAFTPLAFDDYPISHSLAMSCVWGVVAGVLIYAVTRYARGALLTALLVPSHWFLDLIAHRPDLPLAPGLPEKFGWGLWNSIPATLGVESGLFLIGLIVYLRSTGARDKIGFYGFWALIFVLVGTYLGSAFGSPPPSIRTLALVALGQWLFVVWAGWADRHRLTS